MTKNKTTSVVVCALLIIAAVGGISILTDQGVFDTAEAADTGAKPIVGMDVDPLEESLFLQDIAWNSAGTIAVAVGEDNLGIGAAYHYDAGIGVWTKLTHNDGNLLYGVTWSYSFSQDGTFIVVGDGTGVDDNSVGYVDLNTNELQPLHGGLQGQTRYAVATNNNPVQPFIVVVGAGGGHYWDVEEWKPINGLDEQGTYHDVTYDGDQFFIVGEKVDGTSDRGLFYGLPEYEPNAVLREPPSHYNVGNNLWEYPLYGVEARGEDVIIVGQELVEVYDTNLTTYMSGPVAGLKGGETFWGVTWAGPNNAYVVGNDAGGGIIYQYRFDIHRVSEVPGSNDVVTGPQYGVAGRHKSPPMLISVGDPSSNSAWEISQTSGFSDIIVNTYYPHILSVEMFEVGQPGNRLNTQIDVNADGQMDRVYELKVVVRHEVQDILDIVGFSAWHDGGVIGGGSEYPAEDNSSRTQAFRVGWDRNAPVGDEFTWYWPTIDGDQMEVIPGTHEYIEQSGADFDQFEISFRFIPGPQMRFANGENGVFNDNNNPYNKNDALTTPNTWDIEVHATDSQGGFNHSYDEFGVYRFTSLTVQGLPGAYSASAAPGMTDVLLSPGGSTNLTYSANCEHAIKVYLETDLIGQDTGISIPANNMHVQGGEQIKIPFNGSGEINSRYLIGNGFDIWNTPRNRFNYTTTAIGTNDELGTLHPQIEWWVDIPGGIPEDSYRTNIVYVLEHSG